MSTHSFLHEHLPTSCDGCHRQETLREWPHLAKRPFLLSVGHLKEIELPVLICSSCDTANYPNLITYGVLPIHNKCLISVDHLLELRDILVSGIVNIFWNISHKLFQGASMIDSIMDKISLLSMMHGLTDSMNTNLVNVAISIEQCALGKSINYHFIKIKLRT